MKLSAVVVIRNEAPHLISFFEHLRSFCDEILVIDQQSTDNSVQLSLLSADSVYISSNVGWNELDKGFGIKMTKHDWVVVLDPDERFPYKTIKRLPEAIEKAEKTGCEAVVFKVQVFWDGVPVKFGRIPQCRIVKKGIKFSRRIHTNFSPEKVYCTNLIQYHLKDLAKHEERLAERQKLDYDTEDEERIKKDEIKNLKKAKKSIQEEKDFWETRRNPMMDKVIPNTYLRIKIDKTK